MNSKHTFDAAHAMKAAQWEKAKGELRALVAMQGSHACTDADASLTLTQLKTAVEKFIKKVSDNDLYC